MFGFNSKKIKYYEQVISQQTDMIRERERIIIEMRDILNVKPGSDVRVEARALVMANEAMRTIIDGAAKTISKVDKWFESQIKKD